MLSFRYLFALIGVTTFVQLGFSFVVVSTPTWRLNKASASESPISFSSYQTQLSTQGGWSQILRPNAGKGSRTEASSIGRSGTADSSSNPSTIKREWRQGQGIIHGEMKMNSNNEVKERRADGPMWVEDKKVDYKVVGRETQDNQDRDVSREWKSGKLFTRTPKSRRIDPWWMRDEEKNNPRMLPLYRPWWTQKVNVDNSWKIENLRNEARRRGLSSEGKKSELLDRIKATDSIYDMSENGFRSPIYEPMVMSSLPTCYPDIYEKGLNK